MIDGPGAGAEVWITGLGIVGPWGNGVKALEEALAGGAEPTPRGIDRSAGYHRRAGARSALIVESRATLPWVPAGEARRMSAPSRLALAAARQALTAAGLASSPERAAAMGEASVTLATAFGPSSFSEALLRQVLVESPEAASPYLFAESVANAPTAQLAIACGARGPNLTICQREAGPLIALARAADGIRRGCGERALVGAVDEVSPILHALIDRFGALAHGGGEEIGRPFDRRRNGIVMAEGAAVALLESAAAATARGARPLARVLGGGAAFDPTAPPSGWGSGAASLGGAMRRWLAGRGIASAAIGRVVSGGSGSRGGDRVEAELLRTVWPEALPPVLVPKGVVGEFAGGFFAAAILAAAGLTFGPTPGFREEDPELGITPDAGGAPPAGSVAATSVAAGGAAAWVVLAPP